MKKSTGLFLVFVTGFLGIFLFYPLFYVLREAFLSSGHFSTSYFRDILANPASRAAMMNSFQLA